MEFLHIAFLEQKVKELEERLAAAVKRIEELELKDKPITREEFDDFLLKTPRDKI